MSGTKWSVLGVATVAGIIAAAAALWFPHLPEEPRVGAESAEPALSEEETLELERFRERNEGARAELLRNDAMLLSYALQDIESYFGEYEAGIEAFVDDLYSLRGKWNLLRHLSRDVMDLPDEAREIFDREWAASIGHGGFWHAVRSGGILDVIGAVALHGYSFPAVEGYVAELWQEHFDDRFDLDRAIAARIDRLRYELTASRNRFALELQEHVLELDESLRLAAVEIPFSLERMMASVVAESGAETAAKAIGVELLALGGSEAAALGSLAALRGMSNQAAAAAGRNLAASIGARVGTRAAVWLGSRFATFGTAILVAVVVDYGIDRYFKARMNEELKEYFAGFRDSMWEGDAERAGLRPQLTAAFLNYHENLGVAMDRAVARSLRADGREWIQVAGGD